MIHPTAIVNPKAKLGNDVIIGPYAIIEEEVEIGDRVQIAPHVHVREDPRVRPHDGFGSEAGLRFLSHHGRGLTLGRPGPSLRPHFWLLFNFLFRQARNPSSHQRRHGLLDAFRFRDLS